ncbi:peptidase S8/S53 domain-containing protein [Hypoxylon crocopeplum]|nr:peptidase S8/S53 domain-containing protein [Hypoxylon crocopeplum]
MFKADKEAFRPPTAQAMRQVRIVKPPDAGVIPDDYFIKFGKQPNKSPRHDATEVKPDPEPSVIVEGGFDGELFSKPVPASGLVQPKVFDKLLETWRDHFDFKEADKRIRVAILDTGIDLDHEDWLQPRAVRFEDGKPVPASGEPRQIDRIRNKMNFCGGSETNVQDIDGHGTQVASIILRLAPRAEVDIARVCVGSRIGGSSADRCPQPSAVAKAIDWAISNRVSIINMSFGYKWFNKDVREALSRARHNNIVVFAAMSNGGIFEPASWPAREAEYAIGIHSCDNDGKRSGFTAPPAPDNPNFMVVGENIVTHRPKAKGGGFKLDDGTSFATPVAASMAALILAFVEQKICKMERRRAQELVVLEDLYGHRMALLLKSISTLDDPRYLLIHPKLLWKDCRAGESKEQCRSRAWDVIKKALEP